MNDKLAPLVLAALRKAAAESAGLPLFNHRGHAGLLPNTALGKQAADFVMTQQLLKPIDGAELWTISEAGNEHLLNETSPRQVLEDCLRVLEARAEQIESLEASVVQLRSTIAGMSRSVNRVMPSLQLADSKLDEDILAVVGRWQADAAEDCPLPELYRQTELVHSGLTVGRFHDALRRLYEAGKVYLHPWTGPLYAIPETEYALLIGHEIAYYASRRSRKTEMKMKKSDVGSEKSEMRIQKSAVNASESEGTGALAEVDD